MNIRSANINKTIKFESVNSGHVFKYEGVYLMKIQRTPMDDYSGEVFNTVSLCNGLLRFFDDETIVTIVDCELVVNA